MNVDYGTTSSGQTSASSPLPFPAAGLGSLFLPVLIISLCVLGGAGPWTLLSRIHRTQPLPEQFQRGDREQLDRVLGEMTPSATDTLDFRQSNYAMVVDSAGNRHHFLLTAVNMTSSTAYATWSEELIQLNKKRASALNEESSGKEAELRITRYHPLSIAADVTPPRWWTPTQDSTETCIIDLMTWDQATGRPTATRTQLQYSEAYMNIWLYWHEAADKELWQRASAAPATP